MRNSHNPIFNQLSRLIHMEHFPTRTIKSILWRMHVLIIIYVEKNNDVPKVLSWWLAVRTMALSWWLAVWILPYKPTLRPNHKGDGFWAYFCCVKLIVCILSIHRFFLLYQETCCIQNPPKTPFLPYTPKYILAYTVGYLYLRVISQVSLFDW